MKYDSIDSGILSADELLQLKIPEREVYLYPWLYESSLSMIYGQRGIGKSWLSLAISQAVIGLVSIGTWNPGKQVDCLLVDGEMSLYDLQKRVRLFDNHKQSKGKLTFISSDYFYSLNLIIPSLSSEEFRKQMTSYLNGNPNIRVVIFDNLSSLATDLNENEKMAWDSINKWLISLRFMKIAVIIIHHSGKNGDQRGTSGREDNLDTVIRLTSPQNTKVKNGCSFNIEFTKCRGSSGQETEPFTFSLHESDGHLTWKTEKKEQGKKKDDIIALLGHGFQQKQVAELVACDKSLVSRIKSEAIKGGYLVDTTVGAKKSVEFTVLGKTQFGQVEVNKYKLEIDS